ncbi:MAG: site-specific DNA-methyltransferase, partial [Enterococcus sp.]|nr:site-specific DNA-methyltransferase [Enterococcus sp.]
YEIAAPGGNKFNPPPGRCWSITEKKFLELLNEGKIYFGKDNNSQPNLIRYKTEIEGFAPWTWWPSNEVGHTDEAKKELFRLLGKFDGFDTPKPTRLLKRIVEIGTDTDSLILDFFSGSSTLAQAVIEQNIEDKGSRKFICVQLPEPIDESSEAFQAGYNTIADIGKDRIRKVIEEINQNQKGKLDFDNESKQDFGFKVFKLSDSNFKVWRQQNIETAEELEKQMELFTDPVSKEALTEFMVYELLIKSGFDLNCQIKHENNIYFVNSNEMILLLESVSKDIISKVIKTNPQKVVALDKLFEGNDQLKTNTALQMKDAGIDFKTI